MDVLQQDEIVDIPENRIRYFGGPGKMLLPCPRTVAAVIQKVPHAKLLTTDLLRKRLAAQFDVDGVCPVTTKKSLMVLARNEADAVAYWRVINKNGTLIAQFPGGTEDQATRLQAEGFVINTSGKSPKVAKFDEKLVQFA
jgi:hypothetical protein